METYSADCSRYVMWVFPHVSFTAVLPYHRTSFSVPARTDIVLTVPGIYPFPDADPFILHHRPDVYFLGNQPEFETALVGGKFLACPPW
jgi:hypothetical protein